MSTNIVEFVIKLRENAVLQTEKITKAFKKAEDHAKQLAVSSSKLPVTIADYRAELSLLEQKKTLARTKQEIVQINSRINKATRNLQRLENLPPAGFFTRLRKAGEALTGLRIADLGLVTATLAMRRFTSDSVKLLDVQKQAEAQLQASLESTSYMAGKTFSELTRQASELQSKTVFGDENIIRAQSLMLTFKSVRGVIFDQAMPAVLDLASKMNVDLKEAAVQVGKALQDPISGITALRRVGIQFTKEQETSMKKLVEAGEIETAQLIILQELQSQFGGSAEAAAKAGLGPMKQLSNAWSDFKEKVGGTFLKVTNNLIPSLMKLVTWLDRNGHALKNLVKTLLIAGAAWMSFKIAQLSALKISTLMKTAITIKTVAVNLLAGSLAKARTAMLAFNAAMKANLIGLMVTTAVTAIAVLTAFRKKTSDNAKMLQKAREEASSYYAQERMQLDQLFAKLKKTNPQSAERKQLVKELAETYPELNKQLLDEITNTNNLGRAYDFLIGKIATRARLKAQENLLSSYYDKMAPFDTIIENIVDERMKIPYYSVDGRDKVRQDIEHELMNNPNSTLIRTAERSFFDLSTMRKEFFEWRTAKKQAQPTLDLITKIQLGASENNSSTITDDSKKALDIHTDGGKDALDTITAGGKTMKNFYITINDGLIKEVTNHFASSDDNPETAEDFMDKLSHALQMVVNDVNYTAS